MSSVQAKHFLLHNVSAGACLLLISRPWKKVDRDQYCSKFNLSTIAPVGAESQTNHNCIWTTTPPLNDHEKIAIS